MYDGKLKTIVEHHMNSLINNANLMHIYFDEYKHYIEYIEATFKATVEELDEIKNKNIDYINNLPIGGSYDSYRYRYPQLFRDSTFMSLYSTIEAKLNNLCYLNEILFQSKVSYKDMNGKGIVRARLYLEKIIEVKFDNDNPEWETLKMYMTIRNCKIHNEGKVDDNTKNKIRDKIDGLDFSADNYIYFNDNYLSSFIEFSEPYLKDITIKVAKTLQMKVL